MTVKETGFEGLLILEPRMFKDKRGYFFESFNQKTFQDAGLIHNFIQDNQSRSSYGVIRGLHFQKAPYAQSKLVRAIEGSIFDVAVDIRKGSATYGQWFGLELSTVNNLQLLIPKGFAHGFSVLSETATVLYKCDEVYYPGSEAGIHFADPELNIDWKLAHEKAIVSDKDKNLPFIKELN